MTPDPPNFCPWCGKILPEDIPCATGCPLAHHKVTWEDRYHVWMAYSGVALCSLISWGIGTQIFGNFWGTFFLMIPATVLTLLVR